MTDPKVPQAATAEGESTPPLAGPPVVGYVRPCRYCQFLVVPEGDVGLVTILSGDNGGTYDYCPAAADHKHVQE